MENDNTLKFKVIRTEFNEKQTFGQFWIDDNLICDTIEDTDRHLEDCGCDDKIYARTCIPRGTYKITPYFWHRFKNWYPLLHGVPCFTEILIHSGYNEIDSAGCIIVGNRQGNHLINSKACMQRVRDALLAAKDLNKRITIEIE